MISTLASDGPTRAMSSSTGSMAGEVAIRVGASSASSAVFSASRRWPRRRARPSSTWVRRIDSRRSLSQGFSTKSRAPDRIAWTAISTLPQAVMTTTGRVLSRAWIRARSSRPSSPEVVSRA